MSEYKKVQVKKFAPLPNRRTAESRYWRKFQNPIVVKEFAPVTSIHFSPVAPHDFAVTNSTRVQIYSPHTNNVRKTISRFKDIAYSGTFRSDGKLLVAGGETGIIQVFDMNSRLVLRTIKGHTGPVHVTRFSPNNIQLMSASDDTTVRCWDMAGETEVVRLSEHQDYVRAAVVCEENQNIFLSGSYDHTIKLWDCRMGKSTMTMNTGHPVESLLMFPGAGMIASSASNEVKIWDLLSGGKVLRVLSNHQKTITSMCFDSSYSRILTASLDHHVKIYSVEDYKVTHSVNYPAPLLCVAISPNDTHIVAGMSNGLLSIRRRIIQSDETPNLVARQREKQGGSYAFYIRGRKHQPEQGDFYVQHIRKPRLRQYDIFLKKFQYKKALDAALSKNHTAVVVVSMIEELSHRGGLEISLSGRDEESLEPILKFLVKHITNPRYSVLLIDVANLILDMYSSVVGKSMVIDKLFLNLKGILKQEILFQKQMFSLLGAMDMLFASSNRSVVPLALDDTTKHKKQLESNEDK